MEEKKYYAEEVKKESPFRQAYLDDVLSFLEKGRASAEKDRDEFISPEKFVGNEDFYRKEFVKMLGFPLTEDKVVPTLIKKEFVAKDKNVNIFRLQFSCYEGIRFYAMYFEQIIAKETAPFIIGIHGGSGTPETISSVYFNSGNYNHMIRRATDRGANVLVPQLLLWGADQFGSSYNREHIDGKLRQLGGSITALEIKLLSSLIDYFLENENINKKKLAVMGMSYGGMYAYHLSAFDKRVKACYSSSWVSDVFVNSWADWSYFNAQKLFTAVEVGALISPRPLVVAMGDVDELFNGEETKRTGKMLKEYYKLYGKEENLFVDVYKGRHEVSLADDDFDFFFKHLNNM